MLEVRQVCAFYGQMRALDRVSIEVHAGEIVCLIGAKGAGKTTLLNTIASITPAADGQAFFSGQDITRLAPEDIVRLGISHVPERRQVFGPLTVEENLTLGAYARIRRDGWAEVRRDRDRVFGLFPALRARAGQLAGTLASDEQQMLAVGRGLMARPRLMLLDEPSLNLAPPAAQELFQVLADLRREGMAILLAEQNARAALQLADRGYVLAHGRIVAEGMSGELLQDPAVQEAFLGRRADQDLRPASLTNTV